VGSLCEFPRVHELPRASLKTGPGGFPPASTRIHFHRCSVETESGSVRSNRSSPAWYRRFFQSRSAEAITSSRRSVDERRGGKSSTAFRVSTNASLSGDQCFRHKVRDEPILRSLIRQLAFFTGAASLVRAKGISFESACESASFALPRTLHYLEGLLGWAGAIV